MLKKILFIFAIIFMAIITPLSTPAYADGESSSGGDGSFFGLVPWNQNVPDIDNEDALKSAAIIIAINVLTDITVIAAYLVLGYVIYGGYLYIFSSGDAGKTATGKKTLTQAFIGLAIVMLSSVIFSSIRIALGNGNLGQDCTKTSCVESSVMVTSLIQWVIGVAGLVAVIFVVYGGISYVTSSGDPGKLKKAKDTILYALIGLAIVGLAEVITAFVSNTIRNSNNTTSYLETTNL